MNSYRIAKSGHFIATGICHKDADVSVRERFSIDESNTRLLIRQFKENGGEAVLVLSTCNRTEIYALTNSVEAITELLLSYSAASREDFERYCYVHQDKEAIDHMFKVAVGLESQILGDFQIIGQLKQAFRLSKAEGVTNAFLERLINTVSQSSKQVKNQTEFSAGVASTSYAAVNYIKQRIPESGNKKVLLYGTGKIGQLVCENLTKYIPQHNITVVNRTADKASRLVEKYNIQLGNHNELHRHVTDSDIVIVATGSNRPTITPEMIPHTGEKYFIDLSVPRNVGNDVANMEGVSVIDLDKLSQIADDTLKRRKEQESIVREIINFHIAEFMEWLQQRKYVPTINAIKQRLETIQQAEINRHKKEFADVDEQQLLKLSSDIIKKFTNQLSNQLKSVPTENIDLVHHLFRIDESTL